MLYRIFVLFSLLCLAACAAPKNDLPPAGRIEVYKSMNQMSVYDYDGNLVKTYRIALGGNPIGPKQCEGDMKTPEGLYMIETRNPNSKYHLSLKISYPNQQDVQQAKVMGLPPGGDIFIHGVPNESNLIDSYLYRFKPEWTQGCIAVSNNDIEELWSSVGDGTPIEIFP
jgi:murein L,D-transpeptidase YafK